MAKHHKRLLVGIALGIAVSAVAIGSSAINGRIPTAGSEVTDKVRVIGDRKLPERWAINAAYGRGALIIAGIAGAAVVAHEHPSAGRIQDRS